MTPPDAARAEGDERRRAAPLEQADPARPYRVDWIDREDLADDLPGRLGLTFLPGKHGISSRYPGLEYRRTLRRDVEALVAMGVRSLVLLVEDRELARWGDPEIVEVSRRLGLRVDRFPMPDGGTPASLGEMRRILAEVRQLRARGDVAVACMGGVGRTGLVVACALVDGGMNPAEAVSTVRRVRHPDAVETAGQLRFLERYAASR